MLLGLGAVLGTIPDMGYAFSIKAMIIAATPDIAVRAALDARFVQARAKMSELGTPPPAPGASLRVLGLLVVDEKAVSLALRGTFHIPVLLDTLIPVSAYYPNGKSDWFLHIGSDAIAGRGPGPVMATLLPDLLNINGYAYLMLRGNGIPNLGGTNTDLGGFALGMGFGFDVVYILGVIWLKMSAHAVVGLASNPLMLIGLGGLSGSLHLGPFSLGMTADVKFQMGPGDIKVLYFKVCGEVDLWFTTLRGCVEIGTDNLRDVVTDPGTPVLDHVGLIDWNGRELATPVLVSGDNPGDAPQDLPIVWPDAIPVLEFSTGPIHNLTGGLSAGINKAMVGNGLYGSDELRYTYTLSQLDLLEQDRHTHAWTPVDLSAWPATGAWQLPRHGSDPDLADTPGHGNFINPDLVGTRELALLSGEMHVWTRHLNDGGAGLPHDPLKAIPALCGLEFFARPGWALGVDADRLESSAHWTLPGEDAQQGRLQSYFDVDLAVHYGEKEMELALTPLRMLPSDLLDPLDQGGPVAFAALLDGGSRTFRGGFAIPYFTLPVGLKAELREADLSLTFSEPLTRPVLYVLWPNATSPDQTLTPLAVLAANGTSVPLRLQQTLPSPGGRILVYVFDREDDVQAFQVRYDVVVPWQLLGIQGITRTATQAAQDATGHAKNAAAMNTAVAAKPPGQRKPLLKPDTTYKVVVGIQRQGKRKGQAPATDLPKQVTSCYFRTAAMAPTLSAYIDIAKVALFKAVDSFDPAYLARYLVGWTPDDKTEYWFCADPVAAHFKVDHIAALAELYGHEVLLRVQRTDTPPGHPDSGVEFTKAHLQDFAATHLALAADQQIARYAQALVAAGQPCRIPQAGTSLRGDPVLQPKARYDLMVAFPRQGDADHGNVIPGIVFGTSRYQRARDLLLALGFDAAGNNAHVSGDVPVANVVINGSAVGDRALDEAMERLGLTAWPPAREARTSALWVQDGAAWKLVGVLLEALEPIHRPGPKPERERLALDALTCGNQPFEIVRRNASGSRILFLTTSPFTPAAPLQLAAHEVPPLSPENSAPVPIIARCQVAALPAFLEETI